MLFNISVLFQLLPFYWRQCKRIIKWFFFVFIPFQFFFCIIEFFLFDINIESYWLFMAMLFYFNTFFFFCTRRVLPAFIFHKWHMQVLLHWWSMTVCLLVNNSVIERGYILHFITTAKSFFPLAAPTLIQFDFYSLTFITLTLTISTFIIPFSLKYIKHEEDANRFYFLLNAFVGSMVLLLSASSWWLLLLGWELIGWFSYFLINFYKNNKTVFKASKKALVFNKISDFGLYIFLLSMFSVPVENIKEYVSFWEGLELVVRNDTTHPLIYIGLTGAIVCAFCKSAQGFFYFWLPDSMEAPVPASALIHSATLVSAGVYLLGRLTPILQHYPAVHSIILVTGLITAAFGALSACYQTDIKRILAFSTISHCGVLMVLVLPQTHSYMLLYLVVHGLFKSLSFKVAGELILYNGGYQDIRHMGRGYMRKPLLFFILLFSLTGLGSLPFTIGFFSKNYFLNVTLVSHEYLGFFTAFCLFITTCCSVIYVFRILYYVFFSNRANSKNQILKNEILSNFGRNFGIYRSLTYRLSHALSFYIYSMLTSVITVMLVSGVVYFYLSFFNFIGTFTPVFDTQNSVALHIIKVLCINTSTKFLYLYFFAITYSLLLVGLLTVIPRTNFFFIIFFVVIITVLVGINVFI